MKRIFILILSLFSMLAAQDLTGKKLYINAGHGGHDSNDRPPINDAGYWESEGNLTRALVVETLLKNMGATVVMSRRHNRISDGAALSSLGTDASNQNCDWFHSIHTNAAGGNSTLMLYSGFTNDPIINVTQQHFSGMLTLSNYMGNNIKAAVQTTHYTHAGDYTFYGSGHNYLGVFRYLTIPGTLSESSFHDYWPNTYGLQNLDNRINDGWAIALAFVQYYGEPLPDFGNLAGIVRTKEKKNNYEYISGTNDEYKTIDSLVITLNPGNRIYYGNTTMYVDKYTSQWSQITDGSPINPNNWATVDNTTNYDYYMNGFNNNHGYNRNNGFYLFDSLAYGSYTVVFDAPGYWPDTTQIVIDGSKFFWTLNWYMQSSVPPYVKVVTPENNEAMHPAWEPIVINFSHPMDSSLVRNGLIITPDANLIYSWDENLQNLTLTYVGDSLEVETDYTLTLNAAIIIGNCGQHLDGNGDGISGDDFVLRFTTSAADIYAPIIEEYYPSRAVTFDDLQPIISFIFDEIIDTTSGLKDRFELIRTSGDDISILTEFDVYVVNKRSIVSLFPREELVRGYRYMRYIYGGIQDLFGNEIGTDQSGRLLIDSNIPLYSDTLIVDAFNASLTNDWKKPSFSGTTVNLLKGEVSANDTVVNHCSASSHSMKIYYKFDNTKNDAFLREYVDVNSAVGQRKFTKDDILQAWVFGDGTGNLFRFAVDDPSGTGSHEVSPWFSLDFVGWKLLKWDLREGITGDWPAVSDGTLDGSLNFDSFQIEYVDTLGNYEGTVYIEDLMVLTPSVNAIQPVELPAGFALEQNHPNPFNPSTTISFTLPAASSVRLDIYNVRGEKVQTLVNDYYNAGYWTEVWDGKN
ncbi:Ig-like domain-containing protein, partial [bacterium]|nr:Ig-like domain-containing protein [bacterium]